MTNEINDILLERFGKDSLITIATAVDNIPYCRTVNGYYCDGSFYVITYALSNKMQQIQKNNNICISGEWFTGYAKGINLGYFCKKENEEIAQKLRKVFSSWIDNGHNNFDDENTIILKLVLTSGTLFSLGRRFDF